MAITVQQVVVACKPELEALAKTGRAQHGQAPFAIVADHKDGKLTGACVDRASAVAHVESSPLGSDPGWRQSMLDDLTNAPVTHIPVIMSVHMGTDVQLVVVQLSPPVPKPPGFHLEDETILARFLAETLRSEPRIEHAAAWAAANPNHAHAEIVLERAKNAADLLAWSIAWGMNGCPRIVVPHKLGANLMSATPSAEPRAPWSAYTIEIPPELVGFDVVAVSRNEGASQMRALHRKSDESSSSKIEFPIAELSDKRVTTCLQRLIFGTELEMSHPANVKAPRAGSNIHRLVRPVTVDRREEIAKYIAG